MWMRGSSCTRGGGGDGLRAEGPCRDCHVEELVRRSGSLDGERSLSTHGRLVGDGDVELGSPRSSFRERLLPPGDVLALVLVVLLALATARG